MAEVPAAIPPDVLEAVRPAVEAAADVPAAGDNPVPPAEVVRWFLLFYRSRLCSLRRLSVILRATRHSARFVLPGSYLPFG